MPLPRPLESLFRRAVDWQYAKLARDQRAPLAAQERTFRKLRAALRGTEVARRTGLEQAPDLAAFAASVEPHDSSYFEDMVARVVDRGERSVLFHGRPVFVAMPSGTTGHGKRIVYDRRSIAAFDHYEFAL